MNEPGTLSITFASSDRRRGHVVGLVRAHLGDVLIHADTVKLDSPEERHQFAIAVVELAEGATVASGRVELELLAELDRVLNLEQDRVDEDDGGSGRGPAQAEQLVKLAEPAVLFHTRDLETYASIPVDDHREVWPLASKVFRGWLGRGYFEQHQRAPKAAAVRDALEQLQGLALQPGRRRDVGVRLAEANGCVYLDLGDDGWRVVEVGPAGWRVLAESPIMFRRPGGMLPLPVPTRGGSLADLRQFVNTRDEDWRLVLAWLAMTLRPDAPFPLLLLFGQQGSAKSTVSRLLRSVVDPNLSPVRSRPRDEIDLLIAARGGSIVAFDNLSYLSDDMSDALCRLATGGGIGKRTLYSDADETILAAMRPVILNGIEDLARRADLADRSIVVELPAIPQDRRRSARTLQRMFAAAHPSILGALLDVVADGLVREPGIDLGALPRMADFAVWGAACAPSLGWTADEFLKAYQRNRRDQDQTVLDDSPLTRFIVALVEERGDWTGTMSGLLDELKDRADERSLKDRRWPKDATRLSGAIRRLAPSFQAVGIGVEMSRGGQPSRARSIRLWQLGPSEDPEPGGTTHEHPGEGMTASIASIASADGSDQEEEGVDAVVDASGHPSVHHSVHHRPDRRDGGVDAADAMDARMPPPRRMTTDEEDTHGPVGGAVGAGRAGPGVDTGPGAVAEVLQDRLDEAVGADGPGLSGVGPPARDAQAQVDGAGGSPPRHRASGRDAADLQHGAAAGASEACSYTVLTDAARVCAILPSLMAAPVLGLDCETTGLDPRQHRLRLVQLATADGKVFIFDAFRLDVRLLAPLFEASCGPILVAHNAKFDLGFLAAAGLPVPSHTRLFDSILAALLIEAGAATPPRGYFGLEGVVARFLGVELDKTEQVSDWSGPLSAPQLDYAAMDAAVMVPLHAVLAEQLREHDLERVFRLEMRALPAVVWLEANGAPFDADAWMVLAEQAVRRQLESEQRLSQEAGTLGDDGVATLNWRSPRQVGKLLAERGHVVPNVTEDTLLGLADVEPLARLLLDYREAAKKVGTYGLAFLKHLHPTTGRIHPDWQQLRSRAGRMACSKPNLQQVPKMPAYRACFKPSAGRVLVKADYSQIELRIAAQLAPDARLIAAYQAGEDVHVLTAGAVLGRTNGSVTTVDRQAAKAINFGLLFGCGAATLRASAKSQFGVELSEAEAARFRARFFDVYPGLRSWHRRQPGRDRPIDTRSLAGRRRLGVANFSEQLNTPVQGSGADGFKAGLALLWETRERCPGALPVLVVHDEVVVECDEADADLARDWLVDCLTRGMEAFLTEVPVVVETSIALDWSGSPLIR